MSQVWDSIIDDNVTFLPKGIHHAYIHRKNELGQVITQMIWVNKKPTRDPAGNLYNPKALILIFLN